MNEANDISIFATGHMVWNALQACKILEEQGIGAEVINIHTIKPLDETTVLKSILKTGCAVTAEEHMQNGGLGDAISQVLVRNFPAPLELVAIADQFGESGKPEELLKKFGLDIPDIVNAALKSINRKKGSGH
jgi:transketolase